MTTQHPIFLTTEPEPGVWLMTARHEVDPFGRIEIRRLPSAGVVRYKVIFRGDTIGWSNTLEHACVRLYAANMKHDQDVHDGPPNGRR